MENYAKLKKIKFNSILLRQKRRPSKLGRPLEFCSSSLSYNYTRVRFGVKSFEFRWGSSSDSTSSFSKCSSF
jgi:hypothetical protein